MLDHENPTIPPSDDLTPALRTPGAAVRSGLGSALAWVRDLAFSVLIAVVLIVFIYQPVKVEGTGVVPALTDQERIFINKFTYGFGLGSIGRGDTVVLVSRRSHEIVYQAGDRAARRPRTDRVGPGLRE